MKNIYSILIILLLFILSVILVNPIHEFPLNDDAIYTINSIDFAQNNILKVPDWAAMSLIVHTIIGGLIIKIFGFSFSILRISTIIFSFFNIVIFYFILLRFNKNKTVSLLFSLLLLFNPLYLNLSFTFMTEIYFLFFFLLSLFFYIKFLESDLNKYMHIGLLFSIISILVRQYAIIIPIAFFIYYLIVKHKFIKLSLLNLLIPIITLALFYIWFFNINGITYGYELSKGILKINTLYKEIPSRFYFIFVYMGAFLSPIIFSNKYTLNKLNKLKLISLAFCITFFTICFTALSLNHIYMPYLPNMMNKLGSGPLTLAENATVDMLSPVANIVSIAITIMCFICGTLLVYLIIRNINNELNNYLNKISYIYIIFILFIIYFLFINIFLDRYLFYLLPILLIVLVNHFKYEKCFLYTFIPILLVIAIFSTFSTKNYLSWNEARWKAANYLVKAMKVNPNKIDGGFEFNALYKSKKYPQYIDKKWVIDNEYIITLNNVQNYHTIKKIDFINYLINRKEYIFILQRNN